MHFVAGHIRAGQIDFAGGDAEGQHAPPARYSGGQGAGYGYGDCGEIGFPEGQIVLQAEGGAEILFREQTQRTRCSPETPVGRLRGEGGFELLGGDPERAGQDIAEAAALIEQGARLG